MLKILLFFLMTFMVNSTYAVVDLFDQNRGSKPKPINKKVPKKTPKKVTRKGKKLNLSLMGIFKSNSTILYFKDMKNKSVRVKLHPDKEISLPGYPDLIIEKIENRIVYVKDKKLMYCLDNEKQGIICDKDKGTLKMSMVRKYVPSSASKRKKSINNRMPNNNRVNKKKSNNRRTNTRKQSNPFSQPSSSRR